ncbi:MAG: hypothetical protein E7377_05075 [Clostridiales bacterium]|nr:hypothetical protein [Clostridiales bacterium]
MPAHYTHYYIAREALKSLPSNIADELQPHLPVYFFGAQGADFCFFYQVAKLRKKNLGSYLHRTGGYTAFEVLKTLSVYDPVLRAYTLGYVTHYAADVTFHPFVYSVTKNPLEHSRLENALDRHFLTLNIKTDGETPSFQHVLPKDVLDDLFFAYAAITARCGCPPLKKSSFLRAISIFNAYLPISSRLSGTTAKKATEPAQTEHVPALFQSDNAEKLFVKAVAFAKELLEELLSSINHDTPLPKDLFGKNYLSGI